MRLKLTYIPLTLVLIYFIISPVQTNRFIESIGLFQGIRLFRFLVSISLIPVVFKLVFKVKKYQVKCLAAIALPVAFLSVINIFQLIALPSHISRTHLTGSVKFTAFFLLLQYILMVMRIESAEKYSKVLSRYLLLVFFGIVLQYPFLAYSSGASLSSILFNFGQTDKRVQLFGLFNSSNEDANGSATLLPIVLYFLGNIKGFRGKALQILLLSYYLFVLLYNGSRTPIVITLPVTLLTFYTQVSIKSFLAMVFSMPLLAPLAYLFNSVVISRAFSSESARGGTLGWRFEQVWTPAVQYTTEHSPLFGFGSRGWEYVAEQLQLFVVKQNGQTEMITPHNTYVWSYVCWGLLGLISFLCLIAVLLYSAFKVSQSSNAEIARFGKATFCSMIAYVLWCTISNSHLDQSWIILVSLAGLIASLKVRDFGFRRYG